MKKSSFVMSAVAGLMLLALAIPTFADDAKSTEKTITGEAKCAKCMLKTADKCQTVIEVEGKNGKMVDYYVMANDVSKSFHENVCHEAKKVTATGTVVKNADGKREFTATKIDLAK
jgi:hypothetical protein